MATDNSQKLHTIKLSYDAQSKEPNCEYYFGDDKPEDWPIEIHSGFRMTVERGEKTHREVQKSWFERVFSKLWG